MFRVCGTGCVLQSQSCCWKGSLVQGPSAASEQHKAHARCSPSSLLEGGAGDGDLCYPAAFLFPVKLIISLALVCRMTIFTVQDSQYKQIVKNLGPSYHTHTALLIQKGCMSVKRIRTKPARSDGVGIAFLFLTACVYLWEKTDGSAWFYSPVCV